MAVKRLIQICEEQIPADKLADVKHSAQVDDLLWKPQSLPQQMCFDSPADRTLYGGEPGGGKSAILLILSSLAHRRSIIFRRNYTRLKGMIESSRKLLEGVGRYNGQEKTWRDIPGDRIIEFGAVEYEKQMYGYQGQEHDFIAFDEITEFPEKYFRFLTGWNRSSFAGQRCRVVATCNPPTTREGKWIEDYWGPWLKKKHPNPAAPGEVRWFASYMEVNPKTGESAEVDKEVDGPEPIVVGGKKIRPHSRTFIRAQLADNPFIDTESYQATLQALPAGIRELLMESQFDINFEVARPMQLFPAEWIKLAQERWKAMPVSIRDVVAADVARDGGDRICVMSRLGLWFSEIDVFAGRDSNDGDTVKDLILSHHSSVETQYRIDMVGYGSSGYDALRRLKTLQVVGMNGGRKSMGYWTNYQLDMARYIEAHGVEMDRPRWARANAYKRDKNGVVVFANKRAEWAWGLKELLDPKNGYDIALPPDDGLLDELVAHDWIAVPVDDGSSEPSYSDPKHMKGVAYKVQLEDKEKVKKKLDGKSPDKADALMMCAAEVFDHEIERSWWD